MQEEKSAGVSSIGIVEELGLLKVEYERMAAEIRMYVEQYSPKFTIFGSVILGAIVFAWGGGGRYACVYPLVPYLMFAIAAVSIAQSYVIACLAERIKQIELRIADLNGGVPIMKWESDIALRLIGAAVVVLQDPGGNGRHWRFLNPIVASVGLLLVVVTAVVVFCLVRVVQTGVLSTALAIPYFAITGLLLIGTIWSSFSFFRLGKALAQTRFG